MPLTGPIIIKDPFKSNMIWAKDQNRIESLGAPYVRDNIAAMVKRCQCPDNGLQGRVIHSLGGIVKKGADYSDLKAINGCFVRLILALRADCRALYSVDRQLLKSIVRIHSLQMRKLIDSAYLRASIHVEEGEL